MLPASHDRAYQDFLTLLTEFTQTVKTAEQRDSFKLLPAEFAKLSAWFKIEIESIDGDKIDPARAALWQSLQTEILREFKLLSTDLLFLASARQDLTRQKRIKSIKARLSKLAGYCQIMLKDNN